MTRPLTTEALVVSPLTSGDKSSAIQRLAQTLADAGRVTDLPAFLHDVAAREDQMASGLPGGIGVPHCRSPYVSVPSIAVGISPAGVDFGAPDGPAHLIFLIAAPADSHQGHLVILAALARKLIHLDFKNALLAAKSAIDVAAMITAEVLPRAQ